MNGKAQWQRTHRVVYNVVVLLFVLSSINLVRMYVDCGDGLTIRSPEFLPSDRAMPGDRDNLDFGVQSLA